APVMMSVRSGGTSGAMRATVCWSIVASPKRRSSCLGAWRRLLGQNRVPLPPAITTACNMVNPFSWRLAGQKHLGGAEVQRPIDDPAGRELGPQLGRIEREQRADLDA